MKSAITTAYCEVFNVKQKDVNKKQHTTIIKEALVKVWSYPELLPGETEEGKEVRHELTTPAQGEYSELGDYLKSLDESLLVKTAYEAVFTFYKRMKDTSETLDTSRESVPVTETHEETKVPETARDVESASEVSSDKNTLTNKEKETMSKENVYEALSEIEQTQGEVAAPKAAANALTEQATRDYVHANVDERVSNTKNVKVAKFILAQEPISVRVKGKTGTLTKEAASNALVKFIDNFGVDVTSGAPVFKNVRQTPEDQESALAMYNLLNKAANSDKPEVVNANITDNKGGVLAFELIGGKGVSEGIKSPEQLVDYLVDRTAGLLKAAAADSTEIMIANAKATTSTKTGKGTKAVTQKSRYIPTVKDRKSLPVGAYDYVRVVEGTDTEPRSGVKSEIKAAYKTNRVNKKGQPIFATYRLPIMTEQYKQRMKDEYKEFAPKASAASAHIPVDFTNDSWITAQLDAMANVIAQGIANGDNSAAAQAIMESVDKKKKTEATKQAADM